ncbi:hypothetical protein ABGB18_36475 [Nonomuraea sp. B12E4]|uniref:hypothetical protein n=1 Tax=Nonomuraea sp. B12E4 TaxID=3153564 RepID=UPI00325E886B
MSPRPTSRWTADRAKAVVLLAVPGVMVLAGGVSACGASSASAPTAASPTDL